MPEYPVPTEIYHFTHIDNLSGLINTGAILCKNEMTKDNVVYKSSAFNSVQEQRQTHPVPVSPNGTIHDYVPFYFNSLSPMLYIIKDRNIDGVEMQDLVFFKSTAQTVENSSCKFVFTDGHGIMMLSEYYNDLASLDKIPWNVVNARYWNVFPDGRRLRQSEFLVYNKFAWSLVQTIGVYNSNILNKIKILVNGLTHQPDVEIKGNWFF
ncbi:MAG: DUF4433 domain-containing protein [Methylococcales symbiont of Iophon sp. n. MRB-2018]|nr:MAG: DUF4433 domain-containing protein [Methylococcales symbiont of Iophon sp. n. MRB-2018]KAF3980511.1 MAG: DUF4433 domain-containing protein [Methylococcales symbiont of Iophon sp. n. MRB-2018]